MTLAAFVPELGWLKDSEDALRQTREASREETRRSWI